MTAAHTERSMLDLLRARYTAVRRGTIADRWVRAEHVREKLGHTGAQRIRIADFIDADKYPGYPYGAGLALHGHEVKVSRADWLAELRDPDKARAFHRYMHHWWLVVPDPAIVVPGELPPGWGLMVVTNGKLRAKVGAPRLDPAPLPLDLSISFAAAAARTASREPLRADAESVWTNQGRVCQACGSPAPCTLHQPHQEGPRIWDSQLVMGDAPQPTVASREPLQPADIRIAASA